MIFDPKDFRYMKPEFIKVVKKKLSNGKGIVDVVTELAVMYGLPLTVSYLYIKEEIDEYADICDSKIKELKEFYGI